MKFRRREIIEAEQWFPGRHIDGVKPFNDGPLFLGDLQKTTEAWGWIDATKEQGALMVYPGDWVVTTAEGVTYIAKDGWFQEHYEPLQRGADGTEVREGA